MNAKGVKELPSSEHSVFFYGDDAPSSNIQFINQLKDISDTRKMTEDNYSIGGEVAELESIMAKKLGKEACVFFPTGTLANHIAIRQLGLPKTRAIVPEQSHIYQDSGDSVQQLSGINLVPLGGGDPYFDLPELKEALVNFKRQALHSRKLTLTHPISGELMSWKAPLPEDMSALLDVLNDYDPC